MSVPTFILPAVQNNVTTPQLIGAIGASDVSVALKSGHGALLPTILTGGCSSAGSATALNDTGALGDVEVGDFIHNLTDGSSAIVTSISGAPDSIVTTPLEGGSDNTWQSGDVWVIGMFIVTGVQYDDDGVTVLKRERMKVTNRVTDMLTVVRGYDGDSTQSFLADDFVQLLIEKSQMENMQKAVRNILGKFDALYKGVPYTATSTGSSNAYAVTMAPVVTSYASIAGVQFTMMASFANTGAATVNMNGLGAKNIKKEGGNTALAANDIVQNMPAVLIYNATLDAFVLVNAPANAPATSTQTVTDKTSDFTILTANGLTAYTNNGASGTVKFTLPAAPAAGTVIDLLIPTNKAVSVQPNSGQSLFHPVDGSLTIYASTMQYASLRVIAYSTTQWLIENTLGSWYTSFLGIKGYCCGGSTAAAANSVTTIDRLTVASETCAAISATLDAAKWHAGGMAGYFNGYVGGGANTGGTVQDVISKLAFAAETEANIAATLDNARQLSTTQWQNADVKGYFQGGGVSGSAQIDNMDFAADTSADLGTDLSVSKNQNASVNYANVAGYAMGGGSTGIDKLTYSGETRSTLAGVLPASKLGQIPVWSAVAGYACGGNGGGNVTVIKLTYASDAVSTLGGTLGAAKEDGNGVSGTLIGYICQGTDSTTWLKMTYTVETWSSASATLSSARGSPASIS